MMKAIVFSCLAIVLVVAGTTAAQTSIRGASTTSTQNSGLFDCLLPIFEKKNGH